MSIEIRFRAWDRHRNFMTYSDRYPSSEFRIQGDGSWFVGMIDMLRQTSYIADETIYSSGGVLMRCTGLADKKRTPEFPEGQAIYEGDILKWPDYFHTPIACSNCGHVEHKRDGALVTQIVYKDGAPHYTSEQYFDDDDGLSLFKSDHAAKVEVIGSIYENPQLLEGSNNA